MNQSARNKLSMFAINLENYNGALVNSLKIMPKYSYIISLFLHPTLFQNVVICNFDKKMFFIKHPLLTLIFLEPFPEILLLIGFSPFPVDLYFSKINISVGSVFLEQVIVLSSVIIIIIVIRV